MKSIKNLFSLLIILALCLGAAACSGSGEPKTFSSGGMRITLTDEYEEEDVQGYDICYGTRDSAVYALRERISDLSSIGMSVSTTLNEYAQKLIELNSVDSTVINENGIVYFEYEKKLKGGLFSGCGGGEKFTYLAAVYKTGDSFWLVQFASSSENYGNYRDQFIEFARSVTFA